MSMTYTTRRKLQRIGTIALIVLIAVILAWFCWVIWLERYVVYTRDGATLNFELSDNVGGGQIAAPPAVDETIAIYYNEGENAVNASTDLTQLNGYYIDSDALTTDISGVRDTIATLPTGTAVMVELKSIRGSFYYTSSLADAVMSSSINTGAVDSLITDITSRNLYAIALIPAFRDWNYGLNHVSSGLALPQGYLWVDDDNCYWLDPTDNGTITWLRQIVEELRSLGFDEVVFSDFRMPDTTKIVFDSDRIEAIASAAATMVSACTSDRFAVSFLTTDTTFSLPNGRSRLYLENVGAKNVGATAASVTVADPAINLVFLATTNDTRFDEFSVLRPIGTVTTE